MTALTDAERAELSRKVTEANGIFDTPGRDPRGRYVTVASRARATAS